MKYDSERSSVARLNCSAPTSSKESCRRVHEGVDKQAHTIKKRARGAVPDDHSTRVNRVDLVHQNTGSGSQQSRNAYATAS